MNVIGTDSKFDEYALQYIWQDVPTLKSKDFWLFEWVQLTFSYLFSNPGPVELRCVLICSLSEIDSVLISVKEPVPAPPPPVAADSESESESKDDEGLAALAKLFGLMFSVDQ